jgi:hypothetical protein
VARFDIRTRKTALRYALENGYVVDASVLNSSMAHMPTRPFTPDLRERLAEYLRLTPLNPARRKQAHRAAGVRLAVEVRSQKHLNENSELQIYLLRFLDGEPLQEKGAPQRFCEQVNGEPSTQHVRVELFPHTQRAGGARKATGRSSACR